MCLCGFLGFPGWFGNFVVLADSFCLFRRLHYSLSGIASVMQLHLRSGGWLMDTTNFDVCWFFCLFDIGEVFVDAFLRRSPPTMRDVASIALDASVWRFLASRSVSQWLLASLGVLRSQTKRLLTEDLLFPEVILVIQAQVV